MTETLSITTRVLTVEYNTVTTNNTGQPFRPLCSLKVSPIYVSGVFLHIIAGIVKATPAIFRSSIARDGRGAS